MPLTSTDWEFIKKYYPDYPVTKDMKKLLSINKKLRLGYNSNELLLNIEKKEIEDRIMKETINAFEKS